MEKQIDLMELLRLYMRRWWVLIIGIVVGAVVSGTFTRFFITPMYVSAGSLYTENSNDEIIQRDVTDVNLNTIMVRKELVQTYAEILTSNVFLKRVAEESGLKYNHEQILAMLAMESKNETEILVVSVESANPKHAYIIAQTIVNLANEQISSVVEGGSVKILDEPEMPKVPSSPNLVTNIEIGMLAGLLLSMVIVFVIEMIDNKVKSAEHLTDMFSYPVLGEVPYFSSTGKKNKQAKTAKKSAV